jgi:sulfur relay protein TusB/DsrH
MLVLIKSAPDTTDGMRGVALARDGGADMVLLQNGVLFAQKERLADFPGSIYIMHDDKRLRGLREDELDARVKTIDYDRLTDLMTESDQVVGMF